jgi:hypothetical protein
MTTTTIKHQEEIRVIKTPNQRMQEINIKQGMVFKVYRQQNHPFPDESFIIVSATVAEVMQTSKYNYITFEVMNEIEVIIK